MLAARPKRTASGSAAVERGMSAAILQQKKPLDSRRLALIADHKENECEKEVRKPRNNGIEPCVGSEDGHSNDRVSSSL